jgi:hypothetical protein
MKTKYFLLTTLLSILLCTVSFSQEKDYKYFPAQLSFVYPIGTSGYQSMNYLYNFSINTFMGYNAGVDGFEAGGLINMNEDHMSGFQVSGIGNILNGDVNGMQVGGLFSLTKDLNGMQINGMLSKSDKVSGVQIAGILNLAQSSDVMISGIANINTGTSDGFQLAGIYNQSKTLKGFQLGLVNVVDTIDKGFSLGFINIAKNEFYTEWTVSTADYLNLGLSFKMGTKQFYNIYSIGYNFTEDPLWVAGLGFGHLSDINVHYAFQPEIVCYGYFPKDLDKHIRDTYVLHLKFGIVRNISDHLSVSFAPSIYGSLKSDRGKYDLYGYEQSPVESIYSYKPRYSNSKLELGYGFSLGLNFR